jgi:hypothetical protein
MPACQRTDSDDRGESCPAEKYVGGRRGVGRLCANPSGIFGYGTHRACGDVPNRQNPAGRRRRLSIVPGAQRPSRSGEPKGKEQGSSDSLSALQNRDRVGPTPSKIPAHPSIGCGSIPAHLRCSTSFRNLRSRARALTGVSLVFQALVENGPNDFEDAKKVPLECVEAHAI